MMEGRIDIRQLRHDQARKQKLDLKRTVSHMYDLPLNRMRCGRSCLWNTLLGRRSRLGGLFVVEPRHLVAEVV